MEEFYTVKDRKLNFLEKTYLLEILKGLYITSKHFFINMSIHIFHLFGIMKNKKAGVTIYYPEEKHFIPDIYRARHRLNKRKNGQVKCVACMLCATICPANCISITPADSLGDCPRIGSVPEEVEKYPEKFEIDLLRCVFCGYCVEACPVDAIRMDLHKLDLPDYSREKFILEKKDLLL